MIGDNPNNIFLKLELCGPKKDQAEIEIRADPFVIVNPHVNLRKEIL